MAGALGLRLAGPRVYGGVTVEDAFMGEGRRNAGVRDIRRALRLYRAACALQMIVYALLAWRSSREPEETVEVEMGGEMGGELVERRLDILLVGKPRARRRRTRRAAIALRPVREKPVHIDAAHPAISRHRAIRRGHR